MACGASDPLKDQQSFDEICKTGCGVGGALPFLRASRPGAGC